MLTENLLRIPFPVNGLCFLVPISHWLQGKSARINLVTGGFWYDVTEFQASSCKHFQCQNRRFSAFDTGYWKDFQN
jgi:hypothetical protein